MTRIRIEDLPEVQELTPEEQEKILGAGPRARLGLESLERRDLMAGGLTASLSGGVLNIQDNTAGDSIQIRQLNNQIAIVGTTIGGDAGGAAAVGLGSLSHLNIQALGTNEGIDLSGLTLPGPQGSFPSIGIGFGTGNDTLTLPGNFSTSTPLGIAGDSLTVAGYSVSNVNLALTQNGLSLVGNANLPIVGNVQVTGEVPLDGSGYSLGAAVGSVTLGGFTLANSTVTLSDSGVSLTGQAKLPVFGTVTFTGNLASAGTYSLQTPVASQSLFGGVVQLGSGTLTLSGDTVTVDVQATVAHLGQAHFTGSIGADGTYSIAAKASINVAGFSVDGADLTLGSDQLGVSFDMPVPGVDENVSFSGSYGPNGQWSLSGTYPGPVEVGPVTLTNLGFTLTNNSLTLQATGSIADLQDLVDAQVTGTFYSDGRVDLKLTVNALQVENFQLGQAWVDVTNNNPGRDWTMHLHGVVGLPNGGPDVTLDGFVDAQGNYKLTGQQDLQVAGLSLSQASFTLQKGQGLTFTDTWNYLVANFSVSGTIATSGHVHFTGTANTTPLPSGFQLANGNVTVDLDPTHGSYSIELKGTVNVGIAQLNLDLTALGNGKTWQTPTLTTTAAIGGPLASILSGSTTFTIQPDSVTFKGSLSIPNVPGGPYTVNGTVKADGTLVIGGFVGKAGAILAQDAAHILHEVGAGANQIAKALKGIGASASAMANAVYNWGTQDANALLSALEGGGVKVSDLAGVVVGQLDAAGHYLSQLSWNSTGQATQTFYQNGVATLQDIYNSAGNLTSQWQKTATGTMWTYYQNGAATLQDLYNSAGNLASQWQKTATGTMWTYYQNGAATLQDLYNSAGSLASQWQKTATGTMWTYYQNGATTLQDLYDSAGNLASQWQKTATGTMWTYYQNGAATLQDLYNSAGNLASQWQKTATGTMWTYYQNGAATLQDLYNSAGNLASQWQKTATGTMWTYYQNGPPPFKTSTTPPAAWPASGRRPLPARCGPTTRTGPPPFRTSTTPPAAWPASGRRPLPARCGPTIRTGPPPFRTSTTLPAAWPASGRRPLPARCGPTTRTEPPPFRTSTTPPATWPVSGRRLPQARCGLTTRTEPPPFRTSTTPPATWSASGRRLPPAQWKRYTRMVLLQRRTPFPR